MQEFHRFISSKLNKKSNSSNEYEVSNQHNKQQIYNEDEKYIMQDESEQNIQIPQQQNDQIDPLDAFMSNLQQNQASTKVKQIHNRRTKIKNKQQINLNEIMQQNQDQQLQWQNDNDTNQNVQLQKGNYQHSDSQNNQAQIYQNDGQYNQKQQSTPNIDKKVIQTLKPFDFAQVQLEDFQKDFYQEHQDITRLTQNQVKSYRKQLQIKVSGSQIPRPIVSFGHLSLDQKLKRTILKQGFEKPTPIQCQTLPIALSGRDVIGIAKTGSGKTLAYILPLLTQISHQDLSQVNQGPLALILAPTRQLCQQIYLQTKKYAKKYQIKVSCILGGENKHQQWKMLKKGVDVLVASPGRLIQMIRKKATNMLRVTYLVLDQADKMLSLGFQQQIRSIVSQTRPDRQTLLFTATMKKSMQFLAFDILQSPIRINVGEQNTANQDVKQQVLIVQYKQQKFQWLRCNLNSIVSEGKVLIFCNQRQSCQQIKSFIQSTLLLPSLTLHGDKSQYERTSVMNQFKGTSSILIATDIAGRGIDIKQIRHIINFQCPKTIQAYIHRIGRTGRAGEMGNAISFLMNDQDGVKFAIQLIRIFQNTGTPVTKELQDLACGDQFFKRKRVAAKMGVSFAKGKDATKYLNQILKKQQMGNSRAGLGMNPELAGYGKNQQNRKNFSSFRHQGQYRTLQTNEKSLAEILSSKNVMSEDMSISQLSKIIRSEMELKNKTFLSSDKLKSHFVKSSEGQIGKYEGDQQQVESIKSGKKDDGITITFMKKKN